MERIVRKASMSDDNGAGTIDVTADVLSAVLVDLQKEIHQNAIDHGFYPPHMLNAYQRLKTHAHPYDNAVGHRDEVYNLAVFVDHKIARIHSEVSEAGEEVKTNRYFDVGLMMIDTNDNNKVVGLASELADTVIRVLDLAQFLGVDLGKAIRMKMDYNRGRPHLHGGLL